MISLYIHIPFCTKKCPYCHFYVVQDKEELKDILLQGLLQELERWKNTLNGRKLLSIYLGGGTPILFGNKRVQKLLEEIHKVIPIEKSTEITIEANPENVSLDLLKELFQIGVNRVSIGIQSFEQNELEILGRDHEVTTAEKAIFTAFDAGFQNISIDLMYDVPKQTKNTFQKSLDKVKTLPITHLSLYNLTIEPYTPFEKKEKLLKSLMPDDETSAQMYKDAITTLKSMGLEQYEISAFCKNDLNSHHNIGYWTAREFIGLGPSAFSFLNNVRFQNVQNLIRYKKLLDDNESPIDFRDDVSICNRRKELLALNLRLLKGVDLNEFQNANGVLESDTLKALQTLKAQGLLQEKEGIISLTEKGLFFYDTIASELI